MMNRNGSRVPADADVSHEVDAAFGLLQLQNQLENDEDADRVAGLRSIGKALVQKQRYSEAAGVFESLLSIDPGNVQAQEMLARCLSKLGRWGEAAARYQLTLHAAPRSTEALAGSGLCMLRQDAPAAALASFERCLLIDPAHVGALLGKATCLHLLGRGPEADAAYRDAARLHPEIESSVGTLMLAPEPPAAEPPAAEIESPDVPEDDAWEIAKLENVIAAAVSAEDFPTAAEHCRALTELAPDYYEAWFNLGVFEQRNSNLDAAAQAFRTASDRRPFALEPRRALAEVLHVQGNLDAAQSAYRTALEMAPDSRDVLWNLGLALEEQGDFNAAAERYSDLVKADQDRGEAWFRLGLARMHLKDYDGAVLAFRRALERSVHALESNYNLGLAYWHLKRFAQADEHFRAAVKVQPNYLPARRGIAAVALSEGNGERARDIHRELLERGDSSVEILFNLAVFEHRSNRLHSAIDYYKQALKISPDLPGASAGLALAQSTQSDRRYK